MNTEQFLERLDALVAEGKIRSYGWSTDDLERARFFAEGPHCAAIQHDLNVIRDAPQMLALCDEFGLASLDRSPLLRGALTGKYSVSSAFHPDDLRHRENFRREWLEPTLDKLDALRHILTSSGRTLAQGALAWIWARGARTIPIPGFKTVAQVEENANAMRHGALSGSQMAQIAAIISSRE